MTTLLSDVGGTNARLALARDGALDSASITRFKGDDYASFDDVVRDFLAAQGAPRVSAVCVAVAGPVSGGKARLTNRDWGFSEQGLRDLTGAGRAVLINDLTALGYATPSLSGDAVALLRDAPADRARNGQALVAGFGTGFNVCAVKVLAGGRITCLEAEEGHTGLPAGIMARLRAEIGPLAAGFTSTEETFAGRGLSRLHAAMTGTTVPGEDIARLAREGETGATRTWALFAELAGMLMRELTLRFMPREGIFLAGSVARALAGFMTPFEAGFLAEPFLRDIPANTPIRLIRDDMAALHGCLAALE